MLLKNIFNKNSKSREITTKNMKRIFINIAIFLFIFAIYGFYLFNNNNNKNRINEEKIELTKEMSSSKKYENLDIIDINGVDINGTYQLSFYIKNNSNEDFKEKATYLIFLNKKGDVVEKIETFIPDLKAGEVSKSTYMLDKDTFDNYTFIFSDN